MFTDKILVYQDEGLPSRASCFQFVFRFTFTTYCQYQNAKCDTFQYRTLKQRCLASVSASRFQGASRRPDASSHGRLCLGLVSCLRVGRLDLGLASDQMSYDRRLGVDQVSRALLSASRSVSAWKASFIRITAIKTQHFSIMCQPNAYKNAKLDLLSSKMGPLLNMMTIYSCKQAAGCSQVLPSELISYSSSKNRCNSIGNVQFSSLVIFQDLTGLLDRTLDLTPRSRGQTSRVVELVD